MLGLHNPFTGLSILCSTLCSSRISKGPHVGKAPFKVQTNSGVRGRRKVAFRVRNCSANSPMYSRAQVPFAVFCLVANGSFPLSLLED